MILLTSHLSPPVSQRIEVIILALVICGLIFELVRRKRLMERYAILWLLAEGAIMPMMGYGFFGRDVGVRGTAVSLLAVLVVYGGVQGLMAGLPGRKDD